MLVALILISLLIGIALFAFKSQLMMIQKSKTSGINSVLSFNQLRSSLQSIKFYVVDDYDMFGNDMKKLHFYFNGDKKKMNYITTNPLFSSDIAVVKLTCEDKKLIYKEEPLYGRIDFLKPQVLDDSHQITLFDKLSTCEFAYHKNIKKSILKNDIPTSVDIDIKSQAVLPLHVNIKSDNNITLGIIYNAMYPIE
jgi:hypothetical protein